MTSWKTRALCVYLRLTVKSRSASEQAGELALANPRPAAPTPDALTARTTRSVVAGFDVARVVPEQPRADRVGNGAVLYVPGGSFMHGITTQHWDLVGEIADRTGRDVYVACYGTAPDHDVTAAHRFLRAVVEELVERADTGPLHVVGDSAGGALALLLAQAFAGRPEVSALTLIAPVLDLTLANPGIAVMEPTDPWLSRAAARPAMRSWAGGLALDDPLVSPVFGNHDDLPPTLVLVGSRDIFAPDCERLRDNAPVEWDLTVHVEKGSPHAYPLLPTPEGRAARARLLQHIGAH